ncbi:nuclear transport factor 2 family protein [Variovorax sp. GT1P44]|uniref:nuclear transport factor 2 family protein n=1 Tax=Variovorax sp. GT1P44 TaxID=3443742 RepID=UPI003F47DB1A
MTTSASPESPIARWHQLVKEHDARGLDALLADGAVFLSPVVHTPQVGKAVTKAYLGAAFQVFFNPSFRYVRELTGDRDAVLEFEVEIEGVKVNGVDMIKWNDEGRISEFKVMLRPLKAVNLIHQKMAAMLQANQ